jgi:ribosome-binding factor A
MDELRTQRVAKAMREELSELIRFESADPRLLGIEVTDVIVSSDLHRADVLVALRGTPAERAAGLAGLDAARLYLRRNLMQRLDLFRMPELRFVSDFEPQGGAPLGRLKRRLRRGRSES